MPAAPALDAFRRALAQARYAEAAALEPALEAEARGHPHPASVWFDAGHLYAEHWRFAEAERALARAAALSPGEPAIHSIQAFVRQELGDTAGALATLGVAAASHPRDLRLAVGERLMLPQVYESEADLAGWRERYLAGLAALESGAWDPAQAFELDRGNFLLAYQGRDDREAQRRYSSWLGGLAGAAAPEWREGARPRPRGAGRLRVGFVGSLFRDCTAGRYFERWATGLDPRAFERIVFHTAPVTDAVSRRIEAGVDRFVALRTTTRETAARLAAEALDVIVYPEVGMDAMTYLLAALRLAPVQCAGWGHPVTTGSGTIDAFLTCGAMEPLDAATHYVEPLVMLPGIGVDYPMPAMPPPAGRAPFNLPAGKRLYACPQSLFKIHPRMDSIFASILERDPEAVLVFFQATARPVTEAFGRRLQRTLAERGVPPRGQVKFLPRLAGRDFRALLAECDVVLDTLGWSGGNTSLDAFAAGTPVVAGTGRFMRGRQTAAMLAMMSLNGLVAADDAAYVATAVEVAGESDLNRALRASVAERREALFSRPEPVAALGHALSGLAAERTG